MANDCDTDVHFVPLYSPCCLQNKTTGIFYFIQHLTYLFSLLANMIKLNRFYKIIGFSGPCVDFSLYLLSEVINVDIIQLIQGDISGSKISGFGLTRAKKVFYLPSTYASILQALKGRGYDESIDDKKFVSFVNGIDLSSVTTKETSDENKGRVVFFMGCFIIKMEEY